MSTLAPAPPVALRAGLTTGAPRSVLLIGEGRSMSSLVAELRHRGYGVNVQPSAAAAVARLDRDPAPGVVTAFVESPDELGPLLDCLHRYRPHTPLVLAGDDTVLRACASARERLPFEAAAEAVIDAIDRSYAAIADRDWSDLLVFADPKLREVLEQASRVAVSAATVLIQGESGTGKEVMAKVVHRLSPRRSGAFIGVNCAALPEGLLESELFGHEKGAFTGATSSRAGRFELASGGTLLLDEIGEMPVALQAKLLRVLEERSVERVGGTEPIHFDVRLIATTNRDLAAEVKAGRFRLDLYYRLNVLRLEIPPLRERPRDVRVLAESFLPAGRTLSEEAMRTLEDHSWPGNVRELANVIERAVILTEANLIRASDLALSGRAENSVPRGTLEAVERMCIFAALDHCHGNRTRAAKELGISIRTLRNRLAAYRKEGMDVPEPRRMEP